MKNTVNTRIGLLKNKFNMDSKQFVAKANISPTTLWSIEKGGDLKPKTVTEIREAKSDIDSNIKALETLLDKI